MKDEKQRKHYRLVYPDSYRPSLRMDIDNYEVEDVSEYGLKVKVDEDQAFMIEDSVLATTAFPNGREFDLDGHVVRIDKGYIGLQLDTSLPLSIIRSDFQYINNNYSN